MDHVEFFKRRLGHKWKRASLSLKSKQNEVDFKFKQQQFDSLQHFKDSGFIVLKIVDQSHFGPSPIVPYACQSKNNPILLSTHQRQISHVLQD